LKPARIRSARARSASSLL